MKSISEVIDAVDRCAKDCGIYCRGCPYENEDGDCRDKLLRDDIIYYLRMLQNQESKDQPELPGLETDSLYWNMRARGASEEEFQMLFKLEEKYNPKDFLYLYNYAKLKANGFA